MWDTREHLHLVVVSLKRMSMTGIGATWVGYANGNFFTEIHNDDHLVTWQLIRNFARFQIGLKQTN